MNSISKEEIRKEIKEKRSKLSKEFINENSKTISEILFSMDKYKMAKIIFIYMNMEFEVSTREVITNALKNGKKIAIPKIINDEMEFYYINSLEEVEVGYYGIEEPTGDKVAKDENALMIMPGVAFDTNRHRIGYGKGFYDKYLAKNNIENKIALAFEFQIIDNIPFENYDEIPDIIITEKRVVY